MERRRTETDATDGCITGYSGTRPGDRMRAANATPDLTPAERGVFVALAYHRLDLFTPSDEQLLEECGAILHRSTLVAARKRLRARGLLDWTRPCKKLMYSRLNLSLGGGPDLSATTDMSAASAQPVGGGRHEPEPGSEDDFADLARMRHRFRISMHLCCEPHRFRRSGRRLRVDWRDWLSLWRCAGWWLALSDSHLYGKLGHRACGVLGVAPITGSDGCRSPSGYPDGFHNGAFCKFAST